VSSSDVLGRSEYTDRVHDRNGSMEHGRTRADKRVLRPQAATSPVPWWNGAALVLLATETFGGTHALVVIAAVCWTVGPWLVTGVTRRR
jgi:hypothetical protein